MLDAVARQEVWRYIEGLASAGAGVIVSTHDLADAEQCSHAAFFAEGRIVAMGTPAEIAASALRIPVNAVLFRAQGLLVATVDSTNHAHLHPIMQGRDFGQEIEVLSGVDPEDTLIVNPPDSISDGMQVRVASPGKS